MRGEEALDIERLTRLRAVPDAGDNEKLFVFDTVTDRLQVIGGKSAFGGGILAIALVAAFVVLEGGTGHESNQSLYYMSSNFLGPTNPNRGVRITVQVIRQTRRFTTVLAFVSQIYGQEGKKSWRTTLMATIDFIRTEEQQSPQTLLNFSPEPLEKWPRPGQLRDMLEESSDLNAKGVMSKGALDTMRAKYEPNSHYLEMRLAGGPLAKRVMGGLWATPLDKSDEEAQNISDRYSAKWFRASQDPEQLLLQRPTKTGEMRRSSKALQAALVVYASDCGVALTPLFSSTNPPYGHHDAGILTSLAHSITFHSCHYDIRNWHLEEIRALTGGHGRTFIDDCIFDESGRLQFSTQQSILLSPSNRFMEKKDSGKL